MQPLLLEDGTRICSLKSEQDSKSNCVYSGSSKDQRRHCDRELTPKPEHEMDELLHEQYWRSLGWDDPCTSSVERELFGKCAYRCDAPEHGDNVSCCVLPAWHDPVTNTNANTSEDGISYAGGHQFECFHIAANAKNHHVFVLDCSGSMHGQPWNDLMAAVREYINNIVSSGSSLDIASIVTFDSVASSVGARSAKRDVDDECVGAEPRRRDFVRLRTSAGERGDVSDQLLGLQACYCVLFGRAPA